MKDSPRARCEGGAHRTSTSFVGPSPSQRLDVFTKPEALRTSSPGVFMEVPLIDEIIDPWWGQALQPSYHVVVFLVTSNHPEIIQRPAKTGLIRTKDAAITPILQANTKVLGATFQELCQRLYIKSRSPFLIFNHRTTIILCPCSPITCVNYLACVLSKLLQSVFS